MREGEPIPLLVFRTADDAATAPGRHVHARIRGHAHQDAVTIRSGEPSDVGALLELINGYAARGLLLWRSEVSLRERLAEFVVAVGRSANGESVVGCGALAHLGPGLGEVRSLAVRDDAAGHGVGRDIVGSLLRRARARGLAEVLALTRRPAFFSALGFLVTRRERFPAKLQTDCTHCPRNLFCDEVAMVASVVPCQRTRTSSPS